MKVLVPPIKCQGIKTKLIPAIERLVPAGIDGTWIEPFCGSCIVALNVRPARALLADTNKHIISLYRGIQDGTVSPGVVKSFLEREGYKLAQFGERYYKEVRARFNQEHSPLDFLFLNRSCFNGLMRFNSRGEFNVPFCHKPERFSQAYVTKICNQVEAFSKVVTLRQWSFQVLDFREALSQASAQDFIYADPPYAGRHVDYYNSWSAGDEAKLVSDLKGLPCKFLLSTWHSNKYRSNPAIGEHWEGSRFQARTYEHFYHVGATENLRNSMTEALIANYELPIDEERPGSKWQTQHMFADDLRIRT